MVTMANLPISPGASRKLFDLRQKFMDDSASLRKDMLVKRAELRALWRSDNPDQQQILGKLQEINAVRAKLQEKFVPFRLALRQILPKPEHMKKFGMEDEDRGPGDV